MTLCVLFAQALQTNYTFHLAQHGCCLNLKLALHLLMSRRASYGRVPCHLRSRICDSHYEARPQMQIEPNINYPMVYLVLLNLSE